MLMLHTDVISFSFFIALDGVHFWGESSYVGPVGGKKVGLTNPVAEILVLNLQL